MRATSIQAWNEIQKKLPESRRQVLEIIMSHPGLTGREIEFRLAGTRIGRKANARISELHQQGLIEEVGERHCSITDKSAVTWRWTGETVPRPLTKSKSLKMELVELRNRIASLERSQASMRGAR